MYSNEGSSHPTRVRGLKHYHAGMSAGGNRGSSHPTRVRGLKHTGLPAAPAPARVVAPHAGAWIETPCSTKRIIVTDVVAPHAGAWIETDGHGISPIGRGSSHPTRVRGLKLCLASRLSSCDGVAPHAGAWIETSLYHASRSSSRSSHPTRVRGLKPPCCQPCGYGRHVVAPHAGAWIETWRDKWL